MPDCLQAVGEAPHALNGVTSPSKWRKPFSVCYGSTNCGFLKIWIHWMTLSAIERHNSRWLLSAVHHSFTASMRSLTGLIVIENSAQTPRVWCCKGAQQKDLSSVWPVFNNFSPRIRPKTLLSHLANNSPVQLRPNEFHVPHTQCTKGIHKTATNPQLALPPTLSLLPQPLPLLLCHLN